MKNKILSILFLLTGCSVMLLLCAATDILPNPVTPGNLGSVASPFPEVHVIAVKFADGSTQSTANNTGPGSNLVSRASGGINLLEIPSGAAFVGTFAGTVQIGTNSSSPLIHQFTTTSDGVLHEQHTPDGVNWVDDMTIDLGGNVELSSILPLPPGNLNINIGSGTLSGNLVNVGTLISTDGSQVNNLNPVNITIQDGVLATSLQQTNYTVPLLNGGEANTLRIITANTNAFLTFSGTNFFGWQRSLIVDALTSSVPCVLKINLPISTGGFTGRTNNGFTATVAAGTLANYNFYNLSTSGSNVVISYAGFWK